MEPYIFTLSDEPLLDAAAFYAREGGWHQNGIFKHPDRFIVQFEFAGHSLPLVEVEDQAERGAFASAALLAASMDDQAKEQYAEVYHAEYAEILLKRQHYNESAPEWFARNEAIRAARYWAEHNVALLRSSQLEAYQARLLARRIA